MQHKYFSTKSFHLSTGCNVFSCKYIDHVYRRQREKTDYESKTRVVTVSRRN